MAPGSHATSRRKFPGPHAPTRLVGRATELTDLLARLDAARHGHGSAVMLVAGPGTGKTALADALATASDLLTLRCHGLESEVELPFSGLHQLLLPVIAHLDEIPDIQRDAVRSAVSLTREPASETTDVALGTLTLLTHLAAEQTLLVVIDDAHWIDAATMQVLAFVTRRIGRDALLILATARPTPHPLILNAERLDLGPLAAGGSAELAEACAGRPLLPITTEAVHRATGGNALAIIETVRRLGDDLEQLGTILDEPPPASELIELGFSSRLAGLSSDTMRALAVAATSVTDSADVIDGAIEILNLPSAALDAAEDLEVIHRRLGTIGFSHPLLRSLVFHGISPTEHRQVHGALAQIASDASLRAWHAGAAARGTDDQLADDLAAAAEAFKHSGGFLAAARALERAARLTADDEIRAERLFAAGLSAREASRIEWTRQLFAEAHALATGPRLRLAIQCRQVDLGTSSGTLGTRLDDVLRQLSETAMQIDPDIGRRYLAAAAMSVAVCGDSPSAVQAVRRLEGFGPSADGDLQARVDAVRGIVLVLSGDDPVQGRELLVACAHRRLAGHADDDDEIVGEGLVWVEEYDLAKELIDCSLRSARMTGGVFCEMAVLCTDGYRRLRIGDWTGAARQLDQTARLAEAAGARYQLALAAATLAVLEGSRGDSNVVQTAAYARELAAQHDFADVEPHVLAALGAYGIAIGQGDEALIHLEPLEAWCQAGGYQEPSVFSWQADLVDAYTLVGRIDAAEEALDRLRQRSAATGRIWPAGTISRLTGVLAREDDYAKLFEEAIARFQQIPAPFELARTQLQYGLRLRRSGRRAEAREHLQLAGALFARLGAPVWREHVEAELSTLGTPSADRANSACAATLTSQETVVADLVAQGLTNKEAAAQLFLTPKTIEWHLRQIYRKLEITSRTQLAAHLHAMSGR